MPTRPVGSAVAAPPLVVTRREVRARGVFPAQAAAEVSRLDNKRGTEGRRPKEDGRRTVSRPVYRLTGRETVLHERRPVRSSHVSSARPEVPSDRTLERVRAFSGVPLRSAKLGHVRVFGLF